MSNKTNNLNEQMKQAMELIRQSQQNYDFDLSEVTNLLEKASQGIEGNNYQEAVMQVMAAIAGLGQLAEDTIEKKGPIPDKGDN